MKIRLKKHRQAMPYEKYMQLKKKVIRIWCTVHVVQCVYSNEMKIFRDMIYLPVGEFTRALGLSKLRKQCSVPGISCCFALNLMLINQYLN